MVGDPNARLANFDDHKSYLNEDDEIEKTILPRETNDDIVTNLNGAWYTILCASAGRLWIGNERMLPNVCTFFGHRGKNKVVEAADEDEVGQEHEAKKSTDDSTAKEISENGNTAGRMKMGEEGLEEPLGSQCSVKFEEAPVQQCGCR